MAKNLGSFLFYAYRFGAIEKGSKKFSPKKSNLSIKRYKLFGSGLITLENRVEISSRFFQIFLSRTFFTRIRQKKVLEARAASRGGREKELLRNFKTVFSESQFKLKTKKYSQILKWLSQFRTTRLIFWVLKCDYWTLTRVPIILEGL